MTTGSKILLWGLGFAAAVGTFFAIRAHVKKTSKEEQAKRDQEALDAAIALAKGTPTPVKKTVVSKQPSSAPPPPKPVATIPKIGTKIFANGELNLYTSPQAGISTIYKVDGNYKHYIKGNYIGTFLSTAGTPSGYFWKVLVLETNDIGITTNKQLYVIANQVTTS